MNSVNAENLKFWQSVEETDPRMTKKALVMGQERTSVDAQYKKKMITKAFGMYGMGWGVDPRSEVFERTSYDLTTILHYRAIAFYVMDGSRYEFAIAASIKESYVTKNGSGYLKIDDEAVKKVRTDALTKGFTDLGFCADIHMGKFDDDNYVISQNAKRKIEDEENQEAALKEAIESIKAWVNKEIESAQKLLPKSINGYKASMRSIREKLIVRCQAVNIHPAKYTKHLDQIVAKALEQIENKEENKNAG